MTGTEKLHFVVACSRFGFFLLQECGPFFDRGGVLHVEVADLRAPQCLQVSAAAQGLPEVVGERADIGAGAAGDAEVHLREAEGCDLERADVDGTRFQLQLFAFAGIFIGPFAVFFDGRMDGGHLHDVASERQGSGPHLLFRNAFRGPDIFRFAFQVVGGRGGAQADDAGVFLGHLLVLGDALGVFAGAKDQEPRGQGVERAAMADLGFDEVTQAVHHIEGGPLRGLVGQDESGLLQLGQGGH